MIETPASRLGQKDTVKCVGHEAFKSQAEALIVVGKHRRKYDCLRCRKGEPMGTFFCLGGCGFFHIGHSRRNRERRG